MSKSRISTFQFFSLIFLTRLLTTVTYIPSYAEEILLSDMLVHAVIRFFIGLVVMLPVYFLYKKYPDKNVIEIAHSKAQWFGKTVAILYVAALFYYTVATATRLDIFTGTIVFPETNVNFFLVLVIIICCYGAYLGMEALGRSAVLSMVLVVTALCFMMITLVPKINFLNYTPIFYNGVGAVLKSSLNGAGRTIEYVMIALSLPRVTGKKVKGYVICSAALTLFTVALIFIEIGVMGNFANTQLFPIHSLSALAEFSMFERMDAIVTGVWLLCAFLKIAFLIYLQTDVIRSFFPKITKNIALVALGASLSVICFYISIAISRFMVVDNTLLKSAVVLTASFLIPMIVLFAVRGDRLCKKQ